MKTEEAKFIHNTISSLEARINYEIDKTIYNDLIKIFNKTGDGFIKIIRKTPKDPDSMDMVYFDFEYASAERYYTPSFIDNRKGYNQLSKVLQYYRDKYGFEDGE